MKIDSSKIEKVPKESVDALEKVLERLFPNMEHDEKWTGKEVIDEHNLVPYDNRFAILKNGVATVTYDASLQNGFFRVSLNIDNISEELYIVLLQELQKQSPEVYAALKKRTS